MLSFNGKLDRFADVYDNIVVLVILRPHRDESLNNKITYVNLRFLDGFRPCQSTVQEIVLASISSKPRGLA